MILCSTLPDKGIDGLILVLPRGVGVGSEAELCARFCLKLYSGNANKNNKAVSKMAAENTISNAIVALRPLRDEVDNLFLFEEVKTALTSIFEKHRVGQSSLKRAKTSQIPATALLEGEVKMWLKMVNRRLSPRMKARNAWTVEFKRAISAEIFSLILRSVKEARSAYGVLYKEEKQRDVIY